MKKPFRYQQATFRCQQCEELFLATENTNTQCLGGMCWACTWVNGLSWSKIDRAFAFLEFELKEEGYDLRDN